METRGHVTCQLQSSVYYCYTCPSLPPSLCVCLLQWRMALTWQPDPGSLQQIMHLLKESQSPDTKTQQELKPVRQSLSTCVCV